MLEPYRETLKGVAVESTFNWYWLVDGIQDKGFVCQLVNTAAVKQYDGLKYSGGSSGCLPSRTPDAARYLANGVHLSQGTKSDKRSVATKAVTG